MKIIKVSHNKYIKVNNNISNRLIEDINNIYEIIKNNSDGENTHNHNNIYYTQTQLDTMLKAYSLKSHNHNVNYYTKDEVMNLINEIVSQNISKDEICISESAPLNNEKIWFKVIR